MKKNLMRRNNYDGSNGMACGRKDLGVVFVSTVLMANNPYFNVVVPLVLCEICKKIPIEQVDIMILKRIEGEN